MPLYQQFFNLTTTPFSIAPDPHFIYMSEQHEEGFAHLLYGIKHGGGFVALTGEVGTGKTTLCHCLLERLPVDVDIALVFNPKLSAFELLATICDELQIVYDEDKQSLKSLIDRLNEHLLNTHATGRRTVLLIDEAQNLSLDVLEQIRLLTNLETAKTKLLQIILVGQPELKLLLEKPELRQLNQRITARYHLTPLSYSETEKYIKHRLSICGGTKGLFNPAAIKKVYKLSKGIPRLINVICDKALLGAYASGLRPVTASIIDQAAKEVFNSSGFWGNKLLFKVISGLAILAVLAIIAYYLFSGSEKESDVVLSETLNIPIKAVNENSKIEKIKLPTPPEVVEVVKVPEVSKIAEVSEVESINRVQPPLAVDFKRSLKQQTNSLNTKISQLAKIWDKDLSNEAGCKGVKESGLRCLFGRTNWEDLIALNRPVILEFSISKTEKRYVLLVGLNGIQPVFKFNEETVFPIEQMVTHWDGYYLMLWKSPLKDGKTIHPGQSSRGVFWVRKQLALKPSHSLSTQYSILFNEELKGEVIKFQKQQNLLTDGIIGPRTFIHLQNIDPKDLSPKLRLIN